MSTALSSKNLSNRIARSNIYADLDLKFLLHPGLKDLRPLYDINAVKNSVKNLVLTGAGDHPFHPEIGSSLSHYLFQNANKFTAYGIKESIKKVLSIYEPRIDQVEVDVQDDLDVNAYRITINFRVRAPDVPTQVQFYLERIR